MLALEQLGYNRGMQTIDRLITFFTPEHYELSLRLERVARTFSGIVTITGATTDNDAGIRLHAKDLSIETVLVDGKEASCELNGEELLIQHPDLAAGAHLVTVSFAGKITDPMHGLYPCFYRDQGVDKELLATQFESHHAREVFPCIDEPEAKATFDVTLTTESDVVVLGNMPVKNQQHEDGQLVTQFDRTPRMSTYLLAWVVGELHKVSRKTKSGTEVSVWSTPAQPLESLEFALDIACRTIDFFNEYFETPYPLPKSDHVALPDFSSGAMENWGLITYREVALIADPATASLDNKRQVALVVAHELSHQWFGNLVTMKWWNDLWLNESFANMMEYVAIDALEPEWQVWLDHASGEVVQALRRDSLDGVQAIQTDVHHPDEISSLFDPSIVYAKGGRLLRMLQNYIGHDALRTGLAEYFKHFAYQNTSAHDLWLCLSDASGKDIASLMDSWITQPGYPVVNVALHDKTLSISQQQFFIGEHAPSQRRWHVPLGSEDDSVPTILTDTNVSLPYTKDTPPTLNHASTSHFLTHYSPDLQAEIFSRISTFAPIDRLKFLNEHVLLSQAGVVTPAALIDLLDSYRDESNEAVWNAIALVINDLKKYVEPATPAEHKLRLFVRDLSDRQYKRLGWDARANEPEADTRLRSLIISLSLYGENPEAQRAAEKIFTEQLTETINPNLRVPIIAHAVRYATSDVVITDLLALHASTTSSELREDIAAGLTATRDSATIQRLLALILDTEVIRPQDTMHWVIWLLQNREARATTWQWIRDNWSWLEETFSGDKSYDSYPRYAASILNTRTQLEEYSAFFTPLLDQPALTRNITVGLTELAHRVELLESEAPAVQARLLNL